MVIIKIQETAIKEMKTCMPKKHKLIKNFKTNLNRVKNKIFYKNNLTNFKIKWEKIQL